MSKPDSSRPAGPDGIPAGSLKLAAFTFCVFISMAIVSPVLDELVRERFHVGNVETSQFLKVHSAAHLLFGLFVGLWSDRLRRRVPLLVAGLAGSGIGTMLLPFVNDFQALLVLRFVEGIFSTFAVGLVFARAIDIAPAGARGRVMALVSSAVPLAYLASGALVMFLGSRITVLFCLSGGLLLVAAVAASMDLMKPEQLTHKAPTVREVFRFFRKPRVHLPIIFGFVDKFTFASFALLTPATLKDVMGQESPEFAGAAQAIFWIGFFIMALPAGRLSGQRTILAVLAVTSALYGAVLVALGQSGFTIFMVLMFLAGGLTSLRFAPTMTWVGELAGDCSRATALGAWNVAGTLGMLAGFAVTGVVSVSSYPLAWGVGGILEIACAIMGGVVLMVAARPASSPPPESMDTKSLVSPAAR